MEFNLPTTKQEMYTILNDLFYHYRVRREGYEDVNLKDLVLTRLEYEPETDERLIERAKKLVSPEQKREFKDYCTALEKEIAELSEKITLSTKNLQTEMETIEKLYAESVKKIEEQAQKSGIFNSSIIVDKTAVLENGKNQKIAEIISANDNVVASLHAKKVALESQLSSAENDYKALFDADVNKKIEELKEQREKLNTEVFKYNNALDEKEQRNANSIKQTKASLELRFLDIRAGEYTKDELVEMGYYEEVIRCVCGYYDTLSATTAYQDISHEGKLAIYLDDYYENIIYLYGSRAGF